MKIAIFTNNYLPNPYGVSTSIESFREELESRGHTVYVFASKFKDFLDENSKVFRYPALDLKFKNIRFPIPIPFSFKINKILKNLEIDVIHSQHPNLLGWQAKRWAKKKNVPLIFTWHTLYDQYAHFAPFFIPKGVASWWAIQNAVKFANKSDQVIVPTPSVGKIIRKWGVKNSNIIAIPTGVDEKNFQNPDKESLRKSLGIGQDKIVVLLHSRLTEEKNILFVFDCMQKVLKRNPEAFFVISGNGNLVELLKNKAKTGKIEKQIFFLHPQKREELKNIYALGDIFVYGSKSETQGTVITEAMYMGLPIVAVSATGVKDLVANQVTGLLVEEDSDLFANAIERLIKDKILREKLSENASRIAKQNYTAESCGQKMLEIYEEVIKSKKNNHHLS